MIEAVTYYEKNGGAVLVRCYGEGTYVEVPACIDGLPVTELADHCFAPEMSSRAGKQQLRSSSWLGYAAEEAAGEAVGPADVQESAYPALCGETLREIVLPDTLTAIGDYAFYNCYHLESLYIPSGVKRLGSGIFVAVNHLTKLRFGAAAGSLVPPCMKDILGEITYEVEVTVEGKDGAASLRLTFPEYYEEAIENTPARLINFAFAGTGFRYRQCFTAAGEIDLPRYDALLEVAAVQEYAPTVQHLAVNRLLTPIELSEKTRAEYLVFLRQQGDSAARWILQEDRLDILQVMIAGGFFAGEEAGEILGRWLDLAAKLQKAEAVSLLMDCRRKTQKKQPARSRYAL